MNTESVEKFLRSVYNMACEIVYVGGSGKIEVTIDPKTWVLLNEYVKNAERLQKKVFMTQPRFVAHNYQFTWNEPPALTNEPYTYEASAGYLRFIGPDGMIIFRARSDV